jgi:hypothetical protein
MQVMEKREPSIANVMEAIAASPLRGVDGKSYRKTGGIETHLGIAFRFPGPDGDEPARMKVVQILHDLVAAGRVRRGRKGNYHIV